MPRKKNVVETFADHEMREFDNAALIECVYELTHAVRCLIESVAATNPPDNLRQSRNALTRCENYLHDLRSLP